MFLYIVHRGYSLQSCMSNAHIPRPAATIDIYVYYQPILSHCCKAKKKKQNNTVYYSIES